jgi:hypothetical protein
MTKAKSRPLLESTQQAPAQILERLSTARRVDALFMAMSNDFLLREKFVTNPAQITTEYVYGNTFPLAKATAMNKLFYSVVSNRKLLSWLRRYSTQYRGNQPSAGKFLTDFGRAVVEHGGDHIVFALIASSLTGAGLDFDDSLLHVIFSRGPGIREDGPDGGTPTGGAGGGSGTDSKTGGQEGGPGKRQLGFLSQGYVLITLEAAIQYATSLRESGALDIGFSEKSAF